MSGPLDTGLRVRCFVDPGHSFATVFLVDQVLDGKRYVGELVMKEDPTPAGFRREWAPSFTLDDEAAQALANRLYDAGFKAKGAAGSAGQLDAVQAHLRDMQEIAKGFLSGKTRLGGLDDAAREMLQHREAEVRAVRTAYECERNTSERWMNATKSLEKQLAQAEQAADEVARLKGVLARVLAMVNAGAPDVASVIEEALRP